MPPVLGKSRFVPIAGSTEDAWPFNKQPVFCPADVDGWHVPNCCVQAPFSQVVLVCPLVTIPLVHPNVAIVPAGYESAALSVLLGLGPYFICPKSGGSISPHVRPVVA